MSKLRTAYRAGYLLPFLLLLSVGCGDGNKVTNPQFQPQITNLTDDFQFQATGLNNVTQTVQYSWQNSGIRANITQSSSVSAGTPIVTIRDAVGTAVYQGDQRTNGTFTSISGTTGAWTIQVDLSGVSGTVNFRVQKGG